MTNPPDLDQLVTALRAHLDEIEQLARSTNTPIWTVGSLHRPLADCRCMSCIEDVPWAWKIVELDGPESPDECIYPIHLGEADVRHIAFHDPVSVLRRVAADRKIIEELLAGRIEELTGWTSLPTSVATLMAEGYGIALHGPVA